MRLGKQTTTNIMKTTNNAKRSASIRSATHDFAAGTAAAAVKAGILGLMLAIFAPSSALGQTVEIVVQPVRVTEPIGFAGTFLATNFVVTVRTNGATILDGTGTNWVIDPINLSVSGLPSLPSGLSFLITDTNGVPLSSFTKTISTNSASSSISLWLWVNATNVAEGVHKYSINASGGATQSRLLSFQSAHVWTGVTFTNGGTADFANSGNWDGGNVPGPTSDVVLYNSSAVDNDVTTTNILISTDTEIGSLRQAITSGGTRRYNVQIEPGKTLKITGTNGLTPGLRDRSDSGQAWVLAFAGDKGTLVVSNENASISTFSGANQSSRWLMNGLASFFADVYQIHISDSSAYPDYTNMRDNNYPNAAYPRQMSPGQNFLARTNVIKCSFAGDTNDWNDTIFHSYSLVIGRDQVAGSTGRQPFYFGISNLFLMNSICFAAEGISMDAGGNAVFNPSLARETNIVEGVSTNFFTNSMSAYFRNSDGGRMAMFALADDAGAGPYTSHAKATLDFSAGTVDALVDRLYISRDRTNSDGATGQGTLTFGRGVFDVNTAIIGYQAQLTNYGPGVGYCRGTLNVSTSGVFRVNDTLHLGFTTGLGGTAATLQDGYGQLNISAGGTVMANQIQIGGISKVSILNNITMTGGAKLIVTNGVGASDSKLNQISMTDSSLTFHVVDGFTNVFVRALTTAGANSINIGSLPTFTSYPVQITLISFETGSGNFNIGSVPPGTVANVLNNANTIDLLINTNQPQTLIWTGVPDGNWNFTSMNWKTSGGVATNFHNGDFVRFDDTALGATTVVIADNVLPGQSVSVAGMIVSNSTRAYTLEAGGGTVLGSKLLKQGNGVLTLNATMNSSVEIEAGAASGFGHLGSATVDSGARFIFSGTVDGAFAAAGTAENAGTVSLGPLSVLSGGTVTNSGTAGSPSTTVTMQSGGTLVNAGSGHINSTGSWTVPTNATVLNLGTISFIGAGNPGITIAGKLEGDGLIERLNSTAGNGPVNVGGVYSPGNNGIGTNRFFTRLNLNSGSTNIFELDINGGVNDMVIADTLNFGQPNNPAIIAVTNITGAFSAGQAFQLFTNSFGDPFIPLTNNLDWNPANGGFQISPVVPGLGMRWDTSDLRTNGLLRVASVSTTPVSVAGIGPLTLINTTFTTNSTTSEVTTNRSTNVVFSMSWPEDHLGYRLELQTNTLQVGISTNWATWPNSWQVTQTNIPFVVTNPAVFFRLVHP